MAKLVYEQIQQLNYKTRQRVALKLHAVLLLDFSSVSRITSLPQSQLSFTINALALDVAFIL